MRHKAPRKPDRLTGSDLVRNVEAQRVQSAIWHFDRAIVEVERVWGTDRLPYLVDHELRVKWWQAMDQLNAAIRAEDSALVKQKVEACLRGLDRLVEAAKAAGNQPTPPDVWEISLDDTTVLRVVRDWPPHSQVRIANAAKDENGRSVVTWSLVEVANMIRSMRLVNKVKEQWPGAEAQAVRQRPVLESELNDEIPF